MSFFSKKEDMQYIKEFDTALTKINLFAKEFREIHFQSLEAFEKNFEKEKSSNEFMKERQLFESHLKLLQDLKVQTDLLIDEAFKLVRNETALTEKDRVELKKIIASKKE